MGKTVFDVDEMGSDASDELGSDANDEIEFTILSDREQTMHMSEIEISAHPSENPAHPDENPGTSHQNKMKRNYKPLTIFRVPEHIRRFDEKAYIPVVASIGPFYGTKPYLNRAMQEYKWQCFLYLLWLPGSQERVYQLRDHCLQELKKQDAKVRSCYSLSGELDPCQLGPEQLAWIMLLDGCFVICLMLKRHKMRGPNMMEKHKQLKKPTMAGVFTFDLVLYDLLKLENQIPFFIIEFLFNQLIKPCEGENIDLVHLALQLFEGIHPQESKSFKEKKEKSPNEYHHLLHLFYSSRIPSKRKKKEAASLQGSTSAHKWIPSATELNRAGVKFKKNKLPVDSFLNITFGRRKMKLTPLLCLLKLCLMFRSGRMEIPPLQIYDYTGPLFRNLIAFEQCYFQTEMYITIYTLFMDCLIDRAEDVQLLHLEGILEYRLSNDQAVADLFNQLGSQIHFTWKKNYLTNQIDEVNEFYGFKWHKWLAGWRRDYLGNPWAIISVLAAIFLLLLTFEQALFAALSYFHSS